MVGKKIKLEMRGLEKIEEQVWRERGRMRGCGWNLGLCI